MDEKMITDGAATNAPDKAPKTGPEQVRLWQERVALARQALEDWGRQSGADRFVQEYNGKFELFFNGLKGKIPVPPINEIWAYVQTDVANTYNRDPYISVNPKAGTVLGAKLWEAKINYHWRNLKTKEEVEPEIIDKDLVGYSFHKVGYEVETEGAEQEMKLVKDELYSARVDWKDIVWNFGAKRPPKDCLWMAQRITKPLLYVRKKYPAAKNLPGVQSPEVDKQAYEKATYRDDLSVAVLWEIWDRMDRKIYLIAEGLNDKFLDAPRDWPEYQDEFPFIMYWDFYAPGKPRPMSAIAPWEPQLHEGIVLMAAAVNNRKRWSRQLLIRKGAMSDGDLDKMERGDDGAILDYTGTGNLNENTKLFDWGTFPPDFFLLMDRLAAIRRDVSGQAEFQRGGVTKTSTRTEGELQMIEAGSKGRTDRRVDRFETHLENIARHMMLHLKANFDFEETIRIVGDTPQEVIQALGDHYDPITRSVTYTPEELEGDYEVEIKAGSTIPLNQETKLKILQTVIQVVGGISEQGISPLLRTLITELLHIYDIKSLEEAYQLEQKAQDEQAQQQSQMAEAGAIKDRAQAAKNVASADKIGAEADMTRLQFHPGSVELPQDKLLQGAMAGPQPGGPQ